MSRFYFLMFAIVMGIYSIASSKMIHVPADFVTIQAGMNAAQEGDTVLVAEGTYYENVRFYGKSVTLASEFILDHNPDHILKTVINGSKAASHDSASCVMFYGEPEGAMLQGFTLTEGGGTVYNLSDLKTTTKYDGRITVEGGGLFFNKSSATVKSNLIINNQATAVQGYRYNGGGGISSFCGNPKIYNNVIMQNRAVSGLGTTGYASGVVFNESNGTIRNNIIYQNTTTAVSALFIDINKNAIIENNTIVGNIRSGGDMGGGINVESRSVVRNNIVWGNNTNNELSQIRSDGTCSMDYGSVEANPDNIATFITDLPDFEEGFKLKTGSAGIDAGHPDKAFDDIEDMANPGIARQPSMGALRNDIGAYGGPFADIMPSFSLEAINVSSRLSLPRTDVGTSAVREIQISNYSTVSMQVDSIVGTTSKTLSIDPQNLSTPFKSIETRTLKVTWNPVAGGTFYDTLRVYHNLKDVENPARIPARGVAVEVTDVQDEYPVKQFEFGLQQNYPNPFNPSTQIAYSLAEKELVTIKLYDVSGREIQTLINQVQSAGFYSVTLDGSDLANGIYFYNLQAGKFQAQKKLTLLK